MPQTTYKGYEVQTTGSNSGTWGTVLNEDCLEVIDRNLGGIVSKSLASADVVLTAEESQNLIVRLTGTLPTDRVVTLTSWEGMLIVENLTSGSFTVTVTDGVAGTVVPQGARSVLIADTSNGARVVTNSFPSGTRMIFQQTSAPVFWTKESSSTYNNAALRFVTGSASTGGSVDFTTAFASQTPSGTVGNTALTVNQIPLHGHPWRVKSGSAGGIEGGFSSSAGGTNTTNHPAYTGTLDDTAGHQLGGTGGGQSHTHTFTGNAINLTVKYADCIIAQKD